MINITESAVKHLRALLAEHEGPNPGLRIFVEHGGCSGLQYGMEIGDARPDDDVSTREDVSVFIDPASLPHLQGAELDYNDDLTGTGFRIRNPNAKRTCGCGTSFEPEAAAAATEALAH